MKKNTNYKLNEILKNDNLLFDLKYDCTFKRVFLNDTNLDYIILLLNKLLKYSRLDLTKNLRIANSELTSNKSYNRSNYADLVCKYKNSDIIFEMNNIYTSIIMFKNNYYLFKQHTSRSNNKNKYGKYNKTFLINFDNYDILHKDELIYKSKMTVQKYYKCIYNNIEIVNINLVYLRKKYYNGDKLNELEQLLLIFIEQDKNKLREKVKLKEIERMIKFMDRLKFEEGYVVTYDKEELDKMVKEEFDRKNRRLEKKIFKFQKKEKELKKIQDEFNKDKDEFNKDKNRFKSDVVKFERDKMVLAKRLKLIGILIEEIVEITNFTFEQILDI